MPWSAYILLQNEKENLVFTLAVVYIVFNIKLTLIRSTLGFI